MWAYGFGINLVTWQIYLVAGWLAWLMGVRSYLAILAHAECEWEDSSGMVKVGDTCPCQKHQLDPA